MLVYLYAGPAHSYWDTVHQARQRRSEVAELKRENAKLRARREALRGPSALEREARRLGMVRPGERPYVLQHLPEARGPPRGPRGSPGGHVTSLGSPMSFDTAIHQWREGERAARRGRAARSASALERVTDAIHRELRRRLGGHFTYRRVGRAL